ncbi:MAG TPA: hypothetical protein VLH15_03985 [Dehalococcoidales bacterium]|nr:hypothetical protein [Dehalococcoidales bacterium]
MRTRWQLLHMLTGILIAFLLGAHMVVVHLNTILGFFGLGSPDPVAWGPMMERSRQWIWVGIYIAMLAVAIFHGLYGLRGIIIELNASPATARWISRSFLVLGVIVFVWAAYVPLALYLR